MSRARDERQLDSEADPRRRRGQIFAVNTRETATPISKLLQAAADAIPEGTRIAVAGESSSAEPMPSRVSVPFEAGVPEVIDEEEFHDSAEAIVALERDRAGGARLSLSPLPRTGGSNNCRSSGTIAANVIHCCLSRSWARYSISVRSATRRLWPEMQVKLRCSSCTSPGLRGWRCTRHWKGGPLRNVPFATTRVDTRIGSDTSTRR